MPTIVRVWLDGLETTASLMSMSARARHVLALEALATMTSTDPTCSSARVHLAWPVTAVRLTWTNVRRARAHGMQTDASMA